MSKTMPTEADAVAARIAAKYQAALEAGSTTPHRQALQDEPDWAHKDMQTWLEFERRKDEMRKGCKQ